MPGEVAGPAILIGNWLVHRKIVDYRQAGTLIFVGKAIITDSAFEEHGRFEVAGTGLDSRRKYKLGMEGESVSVSFPNGSLFVRLVCQPSQRVFHSCGEDRYLGRFVVRGPDQWAEVWSVYGPRKRYRSITYYRRDNLSSVANDISAKI
jgi:hypothetical protein